MRREFVAWRNMSSLYCGLLALAYDFDIVGGNPDMYDYENETSQN
jgi:hypothetical protein